MYSNLSAKLRKGCRAGRKHYTQKSHRVARITKKKTEPLKRLEIFMG